MTADQARAYLVLTTQTETGRDILRQLGYGAITEAPDKGDDASTITVAQAVRDEMARRYGL